MSDDKQVSYTGKELRLWLSYNSGNTVDPVTFSDKEIKVVSSTKLLEGVVSDKICMQKGYVTLLLSLNG